MDVDNKFGNFEGELVKRQADLDSMSRIYGVIRSQGRDLYTFGDRLAVLQDVPRTERGDGVFELTSADLRKISLVVKRDCVKQELAEKKHLGSFYRNMDEYDIKRIGIQSSWKVMDRIKQEGVKYFVSSVGFDNFDLSKLVRAANGELPCINFWDVDLC